MATPYKLDFPDVTDPNFDPDVPFEADNGINYKWNGNAWEVVCGAGTDTDGFLLKHGHIVDDAPGIVEYEWNQDVQVTIKDDNFWTFKNSADFVQLEGLDDDNISLNAELSNVGIHSSSVGVIAEYLFSLESKNRDITLTAASDHAERVNRTIDASSPDEQITNKRYVDETAAFLQGEVVELEEEIEGIAITSERGEWISATSVNPGEFRMVNLLGSNTQDYEDETIVSIFFNNNDANDPSVEHGWADVEVGNILELLDKPDSDYAIFEITGKNPGTGVMAFDVAYVKGVGEATLGDRTRIKIFAKPTGGNLEDYVRIAGDTMTGALKIEKPQPQANNEVSFQIKGKVKQSDGTLADGILFKDYRRVAGSTSSDYVAYYGEGGGDNGLVNLGMLSENLKSFVKKTGDTMSGALSFADINSPSDTVGSIYASSRGAINIDGVREINSGYKIEFNAPDSFTFYSEKSSPYNVFGVVTPGCITSPDSTSNFYKFLVDGKGTIWAGHNAANAFVATEDHHVATKKYVDQNSGGVEVRAGAPDAPIPLGKMWFDTTRNALYLKTGS